MLEKEELLKVEGGAFSFGLAAAITGAIIFIVGVIDGYVRPLKCN